MPHLQAVSISETSFFFASQTGFCQGKYYVFLAWIVCQDIIFRFWWGWEIYSCIAFVFPQQDMGFHGAKFPLPFGPAQGQAGMRKNIELVKKWREAVGEDYPLMIDCYMSLTVPYTIELARRCEPYNVKWIEETLPPDEYEGYARIKEKVSSTLLTTGEHEYTRWGFRTLLEKKCCDVLQPDITCKLGWLVRTCAMQPLVLDQKFSSFCSFLCDEFLLKGAEA